jgi:hypothetical protein
MGTWDIGPFANDSAGDFCDLLDKSAPDERVALLRDALGAVLDQEYVDDGDGTEAVAAAAIVAGQLPGGEEFEADVHGPDEPIGPLPDDLRELAVRALDRVLGESSEVAELWAVGGRPDPDDRSEATWFGVMRRLRATLAAPLADD